MGTLYFLTHANKSALKSYRHIATTLTGLASKRLVRFYVCDYQYPI